MSGLRALPAAQACWSRDAEVVVVGSGAAGITAALTAAARGRQVLLICKDELGGGATPFAQGGMAAVLDPSDSLALHAADTAAAGAGLCDPEAVSALVAAAPEIIGWLSSLGAELGYGHLEGGHSRPRIVHAGGDAVGAEVHRVLRAALLASPVEVLTHAVALDLLQGESAAGLLVGLVRPGEPALVVGEVRAQAVVLATGGFGQAFSTTSNPAGVTGDGLALAARAGAAIRDMEFVQFHPTVLWSAQASGQCPLVTEALRGAGAVLVDDAGRSVMGGRDLAPRDVVAAAMHERMMTLGVPHLWLDATMVAGVEERFPTVAAACRKLGIDPGAQPIPVAPGAHYACGGVAAGLDGRTSVPGLFAVGEVACTGVHGANRLASNSLTEAMITGRRVGDLLGSDLPSVAGQARITGAADTDAADTDAADTDAADTDAADTDASDTGGGADGADAGGGEAGGVVGAAPGGRAALAAATARYAGVLRDRSGLEELLRLLDQSPGSATLDLATVEATSLHTVSRLVAIAALNRTESVGCHRRRSEAEISGSEIFSSVISDAGTSSSGEAAA
jgi:L-aspartate oxidase